MQVSHRVISRASHLPIGSSCISWNRAYSTGSEEKVYLVGSKRTPFGKYGGSLKDLSCNDLALHSSKASLEDVNVNDHVIYANVIPSTPDTLYGSRHIALDVGAKQETPAYNVNRMCGSGIQTLIDAKNMILRGEASCVLAVGSESMSGIPHLTYGTRWGTRYGSYKVVDFLEESLTDKYCGTPMAITAENLGKKYGIDRMEVDGYSLRSHQKAADASEKEAFKSIIAPIELKRKTLSADEHVRYDAKLEDMTKLKSVFKKDGVVTAATASGIVDGAASALVCSEKFIKEHNISPDALIGASSVVGVDPSIMGIGPAPAIRKLLKARGLSLKDIDLFEINEAFASQIVAVEKELELDDNKVNVWGGAIAIGHPLGASGLRIASVLARELKENGGGKGIASACIGGGQGIALEITVGDEL